MDTKSDGGASACAMSAGLLCRWAISLDDDNDDADDVAENL